MNLLDKTGLTYFWGKIKAKFLTNVAWDSTNKKITKTLNGTTSDVVTGATILSGMTKTQVTTALGYTPPTTDTKNTAGSTDTSSKIFLVGATSQAANPQTYSHDTAYVGTDGCLYSGGTKVLTSHQDISGKADKATTLAGYGITDAKIASGTITLGSNTITPLTSSSTLNAAKLSGTIPSGCYTDTKVTQTPSDDANNTYEVLLSGSADNSEHNEGVRKTSKLVFNTNAGQLSAVVGNNHSYMQSDTVGVYEKVSSSVEKICAMISDDICLYGTNNTWDGTYSSLKDALDSLRDYISDVESSYNTLLSSLNTFKAKMKAGDGASVTVSSNSYADKTISFGKTFSSTPIVVTQLTGSGANNAYRANTACYVTSISTTGFTVRIYNSSAAQLSVSFNWIAMEK